MKNEITHNSKFLLKIDRQQNELQIFDHGSNGNMKCLARIKGGSLSQQQIGFEEEKAQ